jgi:membrane associated rhomboid family serine protease
MLLFPYGTNAPIYHWPITTVTMIGVNVGLYFFSLSHPEIAQSLMLEVGAGIYPLQWLTCNFMHADLMHLLGNMVTLWAFGLVVEGKLGAWKTLCIYLGIGVLHGAIVQLLMLNAENNFCLGASAIIFGYMAMSLVWAPENEMECVFIFMFRSFMFEVKIYLMVAGFLALQILMLCLTGGRLSSEYLHAVGAAVGFGVAIGMLKAGWVDCENWDIFSVWAGRHKMSEADRARLHAESPEGKQQKAERLQSKREKAAENIGRAMAEGMPMVALRIHQKMQTEQPGWMIEDSDLFRLICAMHGQKLWTESIPLMREYIKQCPEKATLVQLKLAQIYLTQENSPRKTLKTLDQINKHALDSRHLEICRNLRKKADELYGQDAYELMEE